MTNSFSIIVMYTFREKGALGKRLRKYFRDKLDTYEAESLDESVYALKNQNDVEKVSTELKAWCKDNELGETSSVSIYYCQSLIDPLAYNDIRIRTKIKREQVWGKTKKSTSK